MYSAALLAYLDNLFLLKNHNEAFFKAMLLPGPHGHGPRGVVLTIPPGKFVLELSSLGLSLSDAGAHNERPCFGRRDKDFRWRLLKVLM